MYNTREFKRIDSSGRLYAMHIIQKSYALLMRESCCLNNSNHTKEVVERDLEKYLDIWFNLLRGYPVAPITVVYNMQEKDKYEVFYGEDTWTAICNLDLFFKELRSNKEYQRRFYIENDVVPFEEFSLWTTSLNNHNDVDKYLPYVRLVKGSIFDDSAEVLEEKLKIMQTMMYDKYKETIMYSELHYEKKEK